MPVRFVVDVPPDDGAHALRAHRDRGQRGGPRRGQGDLRPPAAPPRARCTKATSPTTARLQERTLDAWTRRTSGSTPRFAWAKVGVDKGLATNPLLGTGLVAGFRTSGESERPGFAWMFGRDALWTSLAIHSYGDFAAARTALEFLRKLQRDDGKIPHEISQSATLLPWFTDYEYPWASADATPLYVVAQADHWRATRRPRLPATRRWDSIVKAWRFSAATDTDGNGLVENTKFGHGWTEGSPPYPPHEEIYLQGDLDRGLPRPRRDGGRHGRRARWPAQARAAGGAHARGGGEDLLAGRPRLLRLRHRAARSRRSEYDAEPGPRRARAAGAHRRAARPARSSTRTRCCPRCRSGGARSTPSARSSRSTTSGARHWPPTGASASSPTQSELYDPLSYHYGSVWPLFTGWASVGAYRYGRPHVGYQALMANALLTYQGALGYVTELLSGDFNAPVRPLVAPPGLVGGDGGDAARARPARPRGRATAGRRLRFAPQLPADWDRVSVRDVAVGAARVDLALERGPGSMTITATAAARDRCPRWPSLPPSPSTRASAR